MFELNDLKDYGFDFSRQGAYALMPGDRHAASAALASDAALITAPNSGVPVEYLAYLDPKVVEILTAPRRARELAPEVKKGDWTTAYEKWRLTEPVGSTQPYSDFAQGVTSDVNNEWAIREQYLFQTTIKYGDYETAMSSVARINLASDKQRAAAQIIDIDYNRFALLGVQGKEIYGLLNDPNLPDSIAPSPNAQSQTKWAEKETAEIYKDILDLFNQLVTQSDGLIDYNSDLVLAMSPQQSVYLGNATDFNVSVLDMLKKNFSRLNIVTVPELGNVSTSGQTVLMFAREVMGQTTAEIGFSIKVMAHRIVPDLSSMRQKWTASTYGGIIYIPFAFASMVGV